jgi:hypothetical protein
MFHDEIGVFGHKVIILQQKQERARNLIASRPESFLEPSVF